MTSIGPAVAGPFAGVMTTLADDLVSDELWALVEPLLPAPPRPPTAAGTAPSPTQPA